MRAGVSKGVLFAVFLIIGILIGAAVGFSAPGKVITTTVTQTSVETVTQTVTKTTPKPTTTTAQKAKKVLVLFDVGGRGDLSFNDMAWLGAEKAKKELGVEISYLTPKSLADMKPLLEELSRKGEYDLLVLVGFLWTTPLNETADKFPQQKYALIDATTGVVRDNEVDILFKEQEVASLIGVIASGMSYELGSDNIGALVGMDIPPLWRFQIGYYFGAKYFEKKTGKPVKVTWTITGTFTDPATGKQYTEQMLKQGIKVVYGLAGATHLGAFTAVKEWEERKGEKVFAIGQDASQEWIDPYHIPISGRKRVDVAVYTAIETVVKGTWKGGINALGLKEGGVGIATIDEVKWFAEQAYQVGKLKDMTPDDVVKVVEDLRKSYIKDEVWNLVRELEQKIRNGEIVFKSPMSVQERDQIIKELEAGNLDAALAKGSVS
ncbi:MAG: BMP family ABC transporter substrate-binding protein [Candidatus Korarchaeota archaeon]|nr:BMP family ABC transporter substrate-binding protein [Candidatus Korarchaeota archaeon]